VTSIDVKEKNLFLANSPQNQAVKAKCIIQCSKTCNEDARKVARFQEKMEERAILTTRGTVAVKTGPKWQGLAVAYMRNLLYPSYRKDVEP